MVSPDGTPGRTDTRDLTILLKSVRASPSIRQATVQRDFLSSAMITRDKQSMHSNDPIRTKTEADAGETQDWAVNALLVDHEYTQFLPGHLLQ